jgi:hypothetical protein
VCVCVGAGRCVCVFRVTVSRFSLMSPCVFADNGHADTPPHTLTHNEYTHTHINMNTYTHTLT